MADFNSSLTGQEIEDSLLAVGDNVLDTSDANTVSVGVNGDYATIKAAIDYIATQTTFTVVSAASIDMPAVAQSWAQMTDKVVVFAGSGTPWQPGTTPVDDPSLYWFQMAGDSFFYPLEGFQAIDRTGTSQYLTSKVRRPEASQSGTDIAITWMQATKWTIICLDSVVDSDSAVITAPMVVEIKSSVRSLQNVPMTFSSASAGYGRVIFTDMENAKLRNSDLTDDVCLFEAIHRNCIFNIKGGDFWGPPSMVYGSFEMYNCIIDHLQTSAVDQHILNVCCYGDIIVDGLTLIDTPSNKTVGTTNRTNLAFCDYVAARNVVYTNSKVILRYNSDDNVEYFSLMERIGGHSTTAVQVAAAPTNLIVGGNTINVTGSQDGTNKPEINIVSYRQSLADLGAGAITGSIGGNNILANANAVTNILNDTQNAAYTFEFQDNHGGDYVIGTTGTVNIKDSPLLGESTGSATATLGTNSPASVTTPNTWKATHLADGSTGYVPVWK